MARPPSPYRKTLVEECEVISVSTATGNLALHGITFEYSRGGRGGQRRWFRCPRCGRRMFKLYRPAPLTVLCLSAVPRSHLPLRAKARRALGPTRECTRLAHMALHPSWRGPMVPACLSGCICEIGRHGQVLRGRILIFLAPD